MRYALRVVATLTLALTTFVLAQSNSDQSSTEAKIRSLDQQQREAALKQDSSFFEQHIASNYVGVDRNGRELNREQAIQDRKSGKMKLNDIELKSTNVRVFGNTAIVTHDATVKGVIGGKQFNDDERATFVWVKQGNDWKLASSSIVPVQESQSAEK